MLTNPHFRRLLMLSLLVVLLAGACGNEDDRDVTEEPGTSSSASSSPADTVGPVAEPAPESVPLGPSDVGVTADTIKLGAMYPDLSVLPDYDQGDVERMFELAVERVNDAGGINGRMIDLVVRLPIPISTGYDAACAELTEDEEVFAVVGIFLNDDVLCYSQLHDTIVVSGTVIDESQIERSTAPLLSAQALASRDVGPNLDALLESGDLAPGMRVALHGVAADEMIHEQYEAELAARGVNVVASTIGIGFEPRDLQALVAEMEVFAEVWASEQADAVMGSSDVVAAHIVTAYDHAGLELPMLLPEGMLHPVDIMRSVFGISTDPFAHAVAVITELPIQRQHELGINGIRECIEPYEADTGEEVDLDPKRDADERRNRTPLLVSCLTIDLFAAVAEAAGPNLTTESFGAALADVGDFSITAYTEGSLGPDKPDFSDSPPMIGAFDPATETFVPV